MVMVQSAILLTAVMGLVIFFCRVFPFLIFPNGGSNETESGRNSKLVSFIGFVEKAAPPTAMTVLAFNALTAALKENALKNALFSRGFILDCIPVAAAAVFTALIHLWKRNPLISIAGGVIVYMLLNRVF
jgi:branched-subunit amino acid transport protein AzlD